MTTGPDGPSNQDDEPDADWYGGGMTAEEVLAAFAEADLEAVPDETAELSAVRMRQETEQSRRLFTWAVRAVTAQLVLANLVFIAYAIIVWSGGRDLPPVVISAWLTATVVEVVGIVAIIARSLFPQDPKRQ